MATLTHSRPRGKARAARSRTSPARRPANPDPVILRRIAEAREYRAALLRDLWRMRRGPNRQGVADRRRELAATRRRLKTLESLVPARRPRPVSRIPGCVCPACDGPLYAVRSLRNPLFTSDIFCRSCPRPERKAVPA